MAKVMKKIINILCVILLVTINFVPTFTVKAANSYSVEMVTNSSNNRVVGTYANYNEAVTAMNAQNSTSTSVASVYKNGKIINSRYAIFQLKPNTETINLFQNAKDGTAYTYTRPSSMTDSAFISSNENRAEIMYNGFRGWVDINAGNIIPISLLSANMLNVTASGLRLRSSASTSANVIGSITCTNELFTYTNKIDNGSYTWYQISYNGKTGWIAGGDWATETSGTGLNTYYYRYSSGNLLHRFANHTGTTYSDDFTNLGPTPTYLKENVHYYSFDGGIYLYTNLTSMLDDYRNNTYTRSMNANNPNYPYYLYLTAKSVSNVTSSELDRQITNTRSKLYGQGKYFKEAENLYGMNALTSFATAKNESANGTSRIAMDKNNVFGYGANDSCPYDCARSYSSVRDSIMDYAKNGLSSYTTASAKYYFGSHPGTKGSGRNVKYASDPLWGETAASGSFISDKKNGMRDYKANSIAISKYGKYNVPVYKDANTNTVIYNMQNSNGNFRVYNVPVNVIERVGDFYKIYADSNSYQYGYVKVSDFNLTNSEPVIMASDKTITLGSSFNYMNGVSAYDAENGNLTNRMTYDQNVNVNKAGIYKVTYAVTDGSNLKVTKTINITVKGDSEPIINATDKQVTQYTTFDYMNGVSANDATDGNITSKITYDKTVDTNNKGTYNVTYSVTNSNNKTTTKTIKVTVIANEKPVINADDKTIYLNKEFNPLNDISASDKEDGTLTNKIVVTKNEVKTDTPGEYKVAYSVTDSANQTTTKEITVTVAEKVLKKISGRFDLEYFKYINGNLSIKGFSTIDGIDNNLGNDITYSVKFIDLDNGQMVTQNLSRVTNKNDLPYSVPSFDKKDYTYSWFDGSIDISKIPQGNYDMVIVASSEDYYSENIVNNQLFSEQVASAKDSSGKYIITRNDYFSEDVPLQLLIRDEKLADKNTDATSNQYGQFEELNFTGNGKLHLYGNSFSYGSNLAVSTNVTRKLIFENKNNFKRYVYNLDSVNGGLYDVKMPVNDGFAKNKAWYKKDIDISNFEKGTYVIYINTISNISDISELDDQLFTDFSNVKTTIDGREYSFKVNYDERFRVELSVK